MTEKKVATKQERLMFEQLIRQDMENGIQRTISSTPPINPNNYNNNNFQQNKINTPQQNQNNSNLNYPQIKNPNIPNQSPEGQTPVNIGQSLNKGSKKTLAKKFNIKTNRGKREMIWENKRQMKIATYQKLQQEEEYYDQQMSPKMTPQNGMNMNGQDYNRMTPNNMERLTPNQQQYPRRTPINNGGGDYNRVTPNNIERQTPNQQYYPRKTPINQQNMTPNNQQYQQSPEYINDPRMNPQEQYPRKTPMNQPKMTPQQNYQRNSPNNNIINEQQMYNEQNFSPQQYQRNTPNNQIRQTPNQQYAPRGPNDINDEMYQGRTPNQQYDYPRRTPNNYNNNIEQGITPNQQYGYPRRTPNNQGMSPNQYPNYEQNMEQPRMTPQQQYQRPTPNRRGLTPQQFMRRSPNFDPRFEEQEYQNRRRMQDMEQMMGPPNQYQRNTPNNIQRMTPQQYQGREGEYDQRMSPPYRGNTPQQFQGNNSPYDQNNNYNRKPTPNSYNRSNTQIPNDYYDKRPYINDNIPRRTPQVPQYNQQINNQYGNYSLKGSRTPFVDLRTGKNIYNQRGFTPGQNQYINIPNRPPSRPFGDISFKGQNINPNGMEDFQRHNYSNRDNYY